MKIRNKARLVIGGFECSSDEITRIVKTTPTKTWVRGEPVMPPATNLRKENGWQLDAGADPDHASVQESIESILHRLPDPLALTRLPSGTYVEMICVVYTYDVRPFLHLTSEILEKMGQYGIDLDVDIYDLSAE